MASKPAAAEERTSGERRRSSSSSGQTASNKRRHSVLMDTSVKNFQKLLNSAGEFMRDEIENLPLRKYE
jgi:hypothetical protein